MARINLDTLIDIGTAVKAGLDKAAESKNVPITKAAAEKANPVVTSEVKEQLREQIEKVQDVVDNQTNQEPLWKSRVLRGAIGALGATLWIMYNDYADDGSIAFEDLYGYGTAIVAQAYIIYGRLTNAGTPAI